VACSVLYGLGWSGGIERSEALNELDIEKLKKIAEQWLEHFPAVEAWTENVCVARLSRKSLPIAPRSI
jgi:hypothetical protein